MGLKPFAGGSVLPPARGRRAGAAGRGSGGSSSSSAGFGAGSTGDFDFKGGVIGRHANGVGPKASGKAQSVPPLIGQAPVKTAWARAAPNDGGEKAIKDALEMLKMGGLTALPGISNVSALTAKAPAVAPPLAAAAVARAAPLAGANARAAPLASATTASAGTMPVAAAAESEAPAVTEPVAQQEEEEEEEEDDEDDDDDEEGMYGGGMDDDDDDPYGEEA